MPAVSDWFASSDSVVVAQADTNAVRVMIARETRKVLWSIWAFDMGIGPSECFLREWGCP